MQRITYDGRLVGVVFDDRARLVPDVEFGEPRLARFAFAMAAYVLNPDRIADDDPIETGDCEFMARWLLMPNAAFGPLAHLPDERLAEIFEVPLVEVARKRDDLARLVAP